ncbi:MAG: hypothetical protein ABJG41_10535 [Cyclobacteriaceae bacterium]
MMKKLNIYFLSLIVLFGCQEYDDDLNPVSSFKLSKTTVNTFEVVSLENTGSGEFYTIYTGDEGSKYALKDQGDEGIPGNQNGDATFSYSTPGIFTVAFVVSSYADGQVKESVSFKDITVLDTLNTISKITYSGIGQFIRGGNTTSSFYAVESIPNANNEILVPMLNYKHFGYSNRSEIPLIPNISVGSASADISIEKNQNYTKGDQVVHVNFEERFRPLKYTVDPANGDENEYLVSVIEIPEFDEFKLNDVAALNRVHPSKDQVFFMTAPVSSSQDITSITPEFTLVYPNETVLTHDGVAFESGSQALDFSEIVKFDFEFNQEGYEDVFSISSEIYIKALELPFFESFTIEGVTGEVSLKTAGNPATYFVDIELPGENIPEGLTERNWVRALKPVFTVTEAEGTQSVSVDQGGVQTSGVSQNDFSAYYLEYESNPGSFELDNLRKTYFVDRSFDLVTDSITYNNAFSLRTIYKVGVTVN